MRMAPWSVLCGLAVLAAGCGGAERPALYEARGTVTYQGKPVPDATVTVLPSEGPLALGRTDARGKFTLSTGGRPGAVAGPAKVSVTAVERRELSEAAKQEYQRTGTLPPTTSAESRIPTRYNQTAGSGLTITISEDIAKNNFPLELTD